MNSYGSEFGDRLAFGKLLRACGQIEGLERVRFTSPHPRDFTDDVIAAMAETPNVMPSLHMPLQSGSDTILRAMRRAYRRDRYLSILDNVRARLPHAAITTDIIVGFPGETEADFADTLDVVRRARFASAFTFQYSIRAGTPAATMDGQVPRDVVQDRYERLVALIEQISTEENEKQDGTVVEVLVAEGEGRKDAATRRMSGRARDNRLVHFVPYAPAADGSDPPAMAPRPGDIVTTRVTHGAPHHLIADGAPLDVRRTRAGDAWESRRDAATARSARPRARRPRLRGPPQRRPRSCSACLPAEGSRPPALMLIAIVGPTAVGKSDLAVDIALALGGEVINADSMQLYRGMDIGTAKLTMAERRGVPHHLLDVWDVTRTASVAEYQVLAAHVIDDIEARGRVPVLVGGSGLYIRAALGDLDFPGTDDEIRARLESELAADGPLGLYQRLQAVDPIAAAAILPSNGRRIVRALEVMELSGRPFSATLPGYDSGRPAVQVGLGVDRPELDRRIEARVDRMWAAGFEAEVRALAAVGLREGRTASRALGYQQVLRTLDGEWTAEQAREETARATRRFARRQESWFRRDPRITWLASGTDLTTRALALLK